MKFVWIPINMIQIVLIILWTTVCGILGMLLMLITWNGIWVHKVNCLYLFSPMIRLISGVRVKAHGLKKIDRNRAFIYVANHESHLDIVALASVMPVGLFYIAKKELAKVPIMGQYIRFIGHIFIDRKDKEKSMQSMRLAASKIKAGKNVISFPEGTRSKTGEVQIFKRGSFVIAKEGGIPIVPIAISGSRKLLASGSFALRPGTIDVFIGDEISPNKFPNMRTEELAEMARQQIISMLSATDKKRL